MPVMNFYVQEDFDVIGRFPTEVLAQGFAAFYADEQMTCAFVYRNRRGQPEKIGAYNASRPYAEFEGKPNIVDRRRVIA